MKKDKNIKNIKKNYRKNMSDEQKQRYRETRNKCGKYKYCNMTDEQKQKERDRKIEYRKNMSDEQKQKLKDYLRKYYKKYYIEKKLNNKIIQHDNDDNKNF